MPAPKYSLGQQTQHGVITTVYDLGESVENSYEIGGVIYAEGEVELVESEEDAAAASDGSEYMAVPEDSRSDAGAESGAVAESVGSAELLPAADSEPAASPRRRRAGGTGEE